MDLSYLVLSRTPLKCPLMMNRPVLSRSTKLQGWSRGCIALVVGWRNCKRIQSVRDLHQSKILVPASATLWREQLAVSQGPPLMLIHAKLAAFSAAAVAAAAPTLLSYCISRRIAAQLAGSSLS